MEDVSREVKRGVAIRSLPAFECLTAPHSARRRRGASQRCGAEFRKRSIHIHFDSDGASQPSSASLGILMRRSFAAVWCEFRTVSGFWCGGFRTELSGGSIARELRRCVIRVSNSSVEGDGGLGGKGVFQYDEYCRLRRSAGQLTR